MPARHAELSALQQRKPRYRNHEGEACAEVSDNLSALAPIQESKAPTALEPASWTSARMSYAGAVNSGIPSGH
ncbi:DUF397 domain-containing protein [Streptomyces sp. NPDC002067]